VAVRATFGAVELVGVVDGVLAREGVVGGQAVTPFLLVVATKRGIDATIMVTNPARDLTADSLSRQVPTTCCPAGKPAGNLDPRLADASLMGGALRSRA